MAAMMVSSTASTVDMPHAVFGDPAKVRPGALGGKRKRRGAGVAFPVVTIVVTNAAAPGCFWLAMGF